MTGVALIGCGAWGRNLARVFGDIGALRAVVDADPARAAAVATQYAVSVGEDALTAMRHRAVDAIVIATPPSTHFALAMQAVGAGKHVLVEKPLCMNVAHAEELVRHAAQTGVTLMVDHLMLYHPAYRALRSRADEIGPIRYISASRRNWGTVRRDEDVIWSLAPHDIAMVLDLLGPAPSRVQADTGSWLTHGIADAAALWLEFPGGQRADIRVSWLHPSKERSFMVVGERGALLFEDSVLPALSRFHFDNTGVRREAIEFSAGEPLREMAEHFLQAIALGCDPLDASGRDALEVVRVLAACRPAQAHPTAAVDGVLGAGTRVWHWSHVDVGASVGADCSIGQGCYVAAGASIGRGCKIQNGVSVYRGVTLEEDVFVGPNATFTNVHNPRAALDRKHEIRPTLVKRGATIGANATIVCGVTIGAHAFVGAGAVVTRDVPDHALVIGNPARITGRVSPGGHRIEEVA
jgi:UDP-2-acetamido-3-amino-2,3-dideoxy-glucuronate N-acetyltransferase